MQKAILFLMLCLPLLAQASLYKGFDKEGNVAYSDTPFPNSKKISLPAISVMELPKPSAKAKTPAPEKKSATVSYTHLAISSPKNQQTIWNNNQLTVILALFPSLNTKAGDYIQLLMDGKIIVNNSAKTALQIGYVDRGTHRLQTVIRNKQGKVVKRSKTITMYIKHTIIHRAAPHP